MRMQSYEAYNHAAETLSHQAKIILLYEGAISYVAQAKYAIQKEDYDGQFRMLDKAMSILRGLRACLDFTVSEEVALAMNKYYDAIDRLIVDAQCNSDTELCDAIIGNLKTIKAAFERSGE